MIKFETILTRPEGDSCRVLTIFRFRGEGGKAYGVQIVMPAAAFRQKGVPLFIKPVLATLRNRFPDEPLAESLTDDIRKAVIDLINKQNEG